MIESTDKETLQDFAHDNAQLDSVVNTDTASAYNDLSNDYNREAVNCSAVEYGKERAHKGTLHKFRLKYLQRYVTELSDRHNLRSQDTLAQMELISRLMEGKRLTNQNRIADNGLESEVR